MDKQQIVRALFDLCSEQGVKCLYAVESGSRGWGFASPDSDYDVRFFYIRPKNDYLKIDRPRNVIEHMGAGDLDMVGWDIVKALDLLKKSNPSAIEWLSAVDIYHKDEAAFKRLEDIASTYFSSFKLMKHYTSVATTHYHKYIAGNAFVAPKKYLYALRAILSANYVVEHSKPAPIVFSELFAVSAIDDAVSHAISELLTIKAQTKEKQTFPNNVILDAFITSSLEQLNSIQPEKQLTEDSNKLIDDCFLDLLAL